MKKCGLYIDVYGTFSLTIVRSNTQSGLLLECSNLISKLNHRDDDDDDEITSQT